MDDFHQSVADLLAVEVAQGAEADREDIRTTCIRVQAAAEGRLVEVEAAARIPCSLVAHMAGIRHCSEEHRHGSSRDMVRSWLRCPSGDRQEWEGREGSRHRPRQSGVNVAVARHRQSNPSLSLLHNVSCHHLSPSTVCPSSPDPSCHVCP